MSQPSGRVVVAMSGGVDSSVAAALLVEQGYEVIGVMMRLWSEPVLPILGGSAEAATNRCCSVESIHDARGVAERLGIPFYVISVEEEFKAAVVDPFVQGYAAGRTPNPCFTCNRKIRFGALLRHARALGAGYLATGHYAQVKQDSGGRYELWRGADPAKDQSYVLSVLGQTDLAVARFPVGAYVKSQVRELAAARGLPTASRVDSQDLCFVADGDYRRFVAQRAPASVKPGPIVNRQGRVLGMHQGLPRYTIGQRSGLGIAAPQPLYVLALRPASNTLVVGRAEELGRRSLRTSSMHWIAGESPGTGPFRASAQIRYHAAAAGALVTPLDGGGVHLEFDEPLRDITPGQGAVLYDGPRCLGIGLIEEVEDDPGVVD